jgi:putative heme degradation protein
MSTPRGPEDDIRQLAAEVGRLFGLYHEQVDRLLAERTQEDERLRAALGRLDELQAVIARVNQDNDRLRAERDELLAAFRRMADVIEQLRQSRGLGRDG